MNLPNINAKQVITINAMSNQHGMKHDSSNAFVPMDIADDILEGVKDAAGVIGDVGTKIAPILPFLALL